MIIAIVEKTKSGEGSVSAMVMSIWEVSVCLASEIDRAKKVRLGKREIREEMSLYKYRVFFTVAPELGVSTKRVTVRPMRLAQLQVTRRLAAARAVQILARVESAN